MSRVSGPPMFKQKAPGAAVVLFTFLSETKIVFRGAELSVMKADKGSFIEEETEAERDAIPHWPVYFFVSFLSLFHAQHGTRRVTPGVLFTQGMPRLPSCSLSCETDG